jgi:hypothetical protein
MNVKE